MRDKALFDVVRDSLKRPLTQPEVDRIDLARGRPPLSFRLGVSFKLPAHGVRDGGEIGPSAGP